MVPRLTNPMTAGLHRAPVFLRVVGARSFICAPPDSRAHTKWFVLEEPTSHEHILRQ